MESFGVLASGISYLILVVMTGTCLALTFIFKRKRFKWIAFVAFLFHALLLVIHVTQE